MNTAPANTSTLAVFSLVFGILCWFALPFVGAVVAVVCGHAGRREIRRAPPGSIQGDGLCLAGLILGWSQIVFLILLVLAILLLFLGLAWLASAWG